MFNESILIDKAVFHSREKRRQRSEDESSPDFNNVLLTGVIFWESASSQINSTVLSLITTLPDIISPPQSILNFLTKPSAFYKLLLCFARNSIDLEVCQSPSTLKSPKGQVSLEAFPRQIEAKIHTQKKNIFLWYWLHIVSDVSVLHQMVKLEWLRFGNQPMLFGEVTWSHFAWGHTSQISKAAVGGCILLPKLHIPRSWLWSLRCN